MSYEAYKNIFKILKNNFWTTILEKKTIIYLLLIELCFPSNSYFVALTLNVTVIWVRGYKKIIRVKRGHKNGLTG